MNTLSLEPDAFDAQLGTLLTELSDVQRELLALIAEKRTMLIKAKPLDLAQLQPREKALIDRLQACQQLRSDLLEQASDQGLPHRSLMELTAALPAQQRQHWTPQIREAASRSRLLQHHSLANWVLVQRTLIHLSQMLEIIATGGRLCPTYGTGATADTSGNLVDQEA
jgi:FlgN protein